ncbi:hypothetical protein B0H19DRAFT_1085343 [Mycena capillaripes]|nr:hypothetical protein B0H19DRAFT_1085343 [Mycena capillaripes]
MFSINRAYLNASHAGSHAAGPDAVVSRVGVKQRLGSAVLKENMTIEKNSSPRVCAGRAVGARGEECKLELDINDAADAPSRSREGEDCIPTNTSGGFLRIKIWGNAWGKVRGVRDMHAELIVPSGWKNMTDLQTAGASENRNVSMELPKSSGLIGNIRTNEEMSLRDRRKSNSGAQEEENLCTTQSSVLANSKI